MKRKRDLLIYLEDILESSELIATYIADISEGVFYNSPEKRNSRYPGS